MRFHAFFSVLGLTLLSHSAIAAEAGRKISLAWEAEPQAVEYELRFERADNSGASLYFKTKTTSFLGELKPGEYKFSLRAYDKNGKAGTWGEPEEAIVAPLLVEATFPEPDQILNTKNYTDSKITFQWQRSSGDYSYEFKLANESNTFVKVEKLNINQITLVLPEAGEYRWSVQAFTLAETPGDHWNEPSKFTLVRPLLDSPKLAYSQTTEGLSQVEWPKILGAQSYDAKLEYQEFFSTEWKLVSSAIDLKELSYPFGPDRLTPGQYKLSVAAKAQGWQNSNVREILFVVKPPERALASIPDEIESPLSQDEPSAP